RGLERQRQSEGHANYERARHGAGLYQDPADRGSKADSAVTLFAWLRRAVSARAGHVICNMLRPCVGTDSFAPSSSAAPRSAAALHTSDARRRPPPSRARPMRAMQEAKTTSSPAKGRHRSTQANATPTS